MNNKLFRILIVCVFVFFCGRGYAENIASFTHDHLIYTYDEIQLPEISKNRNPGLGDLEKGGRITVKTTGGFVRFSDISGYLPGCQINFPPISLITLDVTHFPHMGDKRNREFIVFCGNTGGAHNLVRIYQPTVGIVATLDFSEGPVEFTLENDGTYGANVLYRGAYIKTFNDFLRYPVYYRLARMGVTIGFDDRINKYAYAFYKKYIDERLESFLSGEDKSGGAQALIAANIIGEREIYCRAEKALINGQELYEIKDALSVIEEVKNEMDATKIHDCEEGK